MAIVKDNYLSGTVGNVVSAKWKDIKYVRTLPRKRSADQWSDKQKAHRKCFAAVNAFAKLARESLIKPIWNNAETGRLSGYNLFIKANKPAFEPAGELIDPRMLKMTTGDLPLPFNIEVDYIDDVKVTVDISWENAQSLEMDGGTDKLMLILFRDGYFSGPMDTLFSRAQSYAHIELPSDYCKMECIYVFFKSRNADEFSDSFAVGV